MGKGRYGPHSAIVRRKWNGAQEVNGIPLRVLQRNVRWKGQVRLHQLREDDEALITEYEWPKKSGRIWYVCVSTGLLFDKQTGRCRQSTVVDLDLSSLQEVPEQQRGMFAAWRRERQEKEAFGGMKQIRQEEFEYAAVE